VGTFRRLALDDPNGYPQEEQTKTLPPFFVQRAERNGLGIATFNQVGTLCLRQPLYTRIMFALIA
jgi:hypothetical protein